MTSGQKIQKFALILVISEIPDTLFFFIKLVRLAENFKAAA